MPRSKPLKSDSHSANAGDDGDARGPLSIQNEEGSEVVIHNHNDTHIHLPNNLSVDDVKEILLSIAENPARDCKLIVEDSRKDRLTLDRRANAQPTLLRENPDEKV